MKPLRQKMINDMKLRRFAQKTQEAYVSAVAGLAKHYNQSPDLLDKEKIQAYLLHLMDERRLSWSTCNVVVCGIRFFYLQTLGIDSLRLGIPPMRAQAKLPEILSFEEIQRLLKCATSLKNRVLLMTTYAAGLRVSEVVNLKLSDIDSSRMMIRVRQGKGNKDRYSILSSRLLTASDLLQRAQAPVMAFLRQLYRAADEYRHCPDAILRSKGKSRNNKTGRHTHPQALFRHTSA